MNYKISVVIPIYQVEDYIKNTIESIVNQSFKDFEVILVNDGSIDSSAIIAEKILKTNKFSYKIINQKNKGTAAARNTGIIHSSGEWIVCIDSDDVIHKDFLMVLYNSCIENNLDVAISNYQMVSKVNFLKQEKRIFNTQVLNKGDFLYKFLTRNIKIIVPGMLLRKDLFFNKGLWFDEKIKFSEDQHFIWKMLFTVDKIGYNKSKLYNYIKREGSIMRTANTDEILTGYYGFCELTNKMENSKYSNIVNYILPRWVFGALRASSKYISSDNFIKLARIMNYEKNMRLLKNFPDYKTRILALMLLTNWKWFFNLNKNLKY